MKYSLVKKIKLVFKIYELGDEFSFHVMSSQSNTICYNESAS